MAAVHFIDRKRDLQGDLRDLTGEARPIESADPPEVGVRLASGKGAIVHNGHKMAIESVEFIGRVMESGAEIERLKLQSPVAEMTASGRLDDWRSPRYQLDARAWAWLEDVFALFAPAGTAPGAPAGRYRYRYRTCRHDTGSGSDRVCSRRAEVLAQGPNELQRADGRRRRAMERQRKAGADELAAYGVTFRDAQVERARLDSQDGRWTFSTGQARARSVTAEGFELTNATASNVKGRSLKGKRGSHPIR